MNSTAAVFSLRRFAPPLSLRRALLRGVKGTGTFVGWTLAIAGILILSELDDLPRPVAWFVILCSCSALEKHTGWPLAVTLCAASLAALAWFSADETESSRAADSSSEACSLNVEPTNE
jgi:hypothetical protein